MSKVAATWLGLGLLVAGTVGLATPAAPGAPSSVAADAFHVATGALALGLGVKGTRGAARACGLLLGLGYVLLGVLGLALGGPAAATAAHGATDARLWRLVPGRVELGTADHRIHLAVGLAFVAAGLVTRVVRAPLAGHPLGTAGPLGTP